MHKTYYKPSMHYLCFIIEPWIFMGVLGQGSLSPLNEYVRMFLDYTTHQSAIPTPMYRRDAEVKTITRNIVRHHKLQCIRDTFVAAHQNMDCAIRA